MSAIPQITPQPVNSNPATVPPQFPKEALIKSHRDESSTERGEPQRLKAAFVAGSSGTAEAMPSPKPSESELDQSFPIASFAAFTSTLVDKFTNGASWILRRLKSQHARKSLRICESLPLGDRRFVAVIQVDQERFLIGYSSNSVSMLARLQGRKSFAEALEQCQEAGKAS